MRIAFTLVILVASAIYTYAAFTDLNFLSSTGRLGPGFFPRIIGAALIFVCALDLAIEYFRPRAGVAGSKHTNTVIVVAALSALFVVALGVIGGYLAMFAFMFAALTFLNRARPVQNAVIALILPSAIYLMFDVWLNAAVPEGILFERWLG